MLDDRRKAAFLQGTLAPEDRRTHPRFPFTAAAEALDAQHRTRMNARTSDIGRGGCYVDTYSPFPLKTGVKLRITRDKACFMAEAKVVYSKIGMGMGLQFTFIDTGQLAVLESWLGELSGTAPMAPSGMTMLDEHGTRASLNGNGNGTLSKESGYVLNELLVALIRKGVLTEEEGKTMILRLLHRDFLP